MSGNWPMCFGEYLATIPEIVNFDVVPNGGMGGTTENNVVVEIYGYDFEATSRIANALADSVSTIKGATNVSVSRDPSKPQLQIVPDREKMAQHGLNTFTVANAVRNRVEGPYLTRYREEGDEYDIVLRFEEEERNYPLRPEQHCPDEYEEPGDPAGRGG